MNTLRDLILTAAGGSVHTATLVTLTAIIALAVTVVIGVGMVYALSVITSRRTPKAPIIIITNAQGE